uniref:EF-hand domain-containing protein n=1 Tax=Chromera velia CCMP2878 TaxID=1169474 RepID=A0A0G4GME1_9ALVE|eukprot:Cvel_22543.t1-p1 / transcript=Cvel_22543.t1 / gene=Cvel_22543 / organism=Chromera_velia_CCMP2878 / gene_product=Calcyphosin-like protein, putative / transcript_product=Calcyphosin-like protein, putative / location=Cvel_scaffold2226:2882-8405(-) / protein_length=1025 / sequence_SO=supercontig / SO=protein_coding / is_pseudo=false
MDLRDLNRFEEELLSKLGQKCTGIESNYIIKLFKYHDTRNCGKCSWDQFRLALEPYAGHIKEDFLHEVFYRYADGGPELDYKKFAVAFSSGELRELNTRISETRAFTAQTHRRPPSSRTIRATIDRSKTFLVRSPAGTLIKLATELKACDVANTRTIPPPDFQRVLLRGPLSPLQFSIAEIQALMASFGANPQVAGPGLVAYDNLIDELKADLTDEETVVLRQSFQKLNPDRDSVAAFRDVWKALNPERHPQVTSKKKTASTLLREMQEQLEGVLAFRRGGLVQFNKCVAWEEFLDFYRFTCACSVERGEALIPILVSIWHLDIAPAEVLQERIDPSLLPAAAHEPKKKRLDLHTWAQETLPAHAAYRSPRKRVKFEEVFGKVRAHLEAGGIKAAVGVLQAFTEVDRNADGFINVAEFRAAVERGKYLRLLGDEEASFFREFGSEIESEEKGVDVVVPLDAVMSLLWGRPSKTREALIHEAFRGLPVACQGGEGEGAADLVRVETVLECFDAKRHPLVEQSRSSEEAVVQEFQSAFKHYASFACDDGLVRLEDFYLFFAMWSSITPDDIYFDAFMRRVWALGDPEVDYQTEAREMSETRAKMRNEATGMRHPFERDPHLLRDDKVYSKPHASVFASTKKEPVVDMPPTKETQKATQTSADLFPHGWREDGAALDDLHERYVRTRDWGPVPKNRQSATSFSHFAHRGAMDEKLQVILDVSRSRLAQFRTLKLWLQLIETFEKYDFMGKGRIIKHDYDRLHRRTALGLSDHEKNALFRFYSSDSPDTLFDYIAWLEDLKGDLDLHRIQWVQRAWEAVVGPSLKDPAEAKVGIEVVLAQMNFQSHPAVVFAKSSAHEAREDFRSTLVHVSVRRGLHGALIDRIGFFEVMRLHSCVFPVLDEFRMLTHQASNIPLGPESSPRAMSIKARTRSPSPVGDADDADAVLENALAAKDVATSPMYALRGGTQQGHSSCGGVGDGFDDARGKKSTIGPIVRLPQDERLIGDDDKLIPPREMARRGIKPRNPLLL